MSAHTKLLSPLWIGYREGRLHARWSAPSWQRLRLAADELQATFADSILPSCIHFRGGVMGTVRTLTGIAPEYRFVAHFDVARYYDSMDHSVLLALLAREDPSERLFAIVSEYLARPSTEGVRRMTTRFHRLYEPGATATLLWDYVSRWTRWLWGGLEGLVRRKGGIPQRDRIAS